ncbi:hypothetical protein JTE90_014445 [Oedothorax gibbosus]|uniref:Senescence domain-containing protein n=1 Tax=Oedothorax gibbosus TaxID=931172 RepID=A0AAV6V159_9ARAC|nr:hypothetical protein JTE90_014445 [Oedothorax gibbosus]
MQSGYFSFALSIMDKSPKPVRIIPMAKEEEEEDRRKLGELRAHHDEAHLYVAQGLTFMEQGRTELARDMFFKGLERINLALAIRTEGRAGPAWEAARAMQDKMRRTAGLVRGQLPPADAPPSYEEACCGGEEVCLLFTVPADVQLFFVSREGAVSAPYDPSPLHLCKIIGAEGAAWLQVGPWTYPLVSGQSPALESGYGALLFPDVGAGRDSAVGVILPQSVTPAERAEFLSILNELTALKEQKLNESGYWQVEEPKPQPKAAPSMSEKISNGIVIGAEYVSKGLVAGAHASSDLIHWGAERARLSLQPEATPRQVPPRVKEGLRVAKDASGIALKATGFMVRQVGQLTLALGRHLAPYGTRLMTSALGPERADTVDGVVCVAAGSVQGFSTIYMGLENAAKVLASSLSSETVNIVGHKYGSEVGEVVGTALSSIGNLALTTHNVQSMGVKAVAKRTAKDAGKEVLKDYAKHVPNE